VRACDNHISDGGSGRLCETRANTDWRGNGEAGKMAFLFVFSAPQAVLVVLPGEVAARVLHQTRVTQRAGLGLTALTGLGAFGFGGKKEFGFALAVGELRPVDERREGNCGLAVEGVRRRSHVINTK